ncbi:YrpD family protein [Priestia taiwanensis]|uniref:Uncharacterized protein n=1 Tax=Priestia taiwanensis TaxID=1347902 RepID=A0A917AXP1_9BACI|nr:YrpD family protein [Priestia taiwanensis]MBM7364658.1 hypothetical protein [Priestia taiwanensis]GGE78578.1 hypothetical protein GCM10007140_30230 [Priestia taiwanensis]
MIKKFTVGVLTTGLIFSGAEGVSAITPLASTPSDAFTTTFNMVSNPIPHGIGGRTIVNSTGSTLTTKVTLPVIKENSSFKVTDGTVYVYSGFAGSVESDIGFQYSPTYDVWKPYMKVGSRTNDQVKYLEGGANFTGSNGFKPGSEVQLTIYKNLNGSTRATYWGTSAKGFTGRLISEMQNTNVGSIKNWKVLSTVANTVESEIKVNKGYSATFRDITVDNNPSSLTVHAQEHAYTTTNGNTATINITSKQ